VAEANISRPEGGWSQDADLRVCAWPHEDLLHIAKLDLAADFAREHKGLSVVEDECI